jgi:PII-like signaling protein
MFPGPARKLTIYLTESDTRHGRPLYQILVDLAHRRGLAGATVVRGLMGFGARGKIHEPHPDLVSKLPMRVELIDSAAAIDAILPDVHDLVADGLVLLSEVDVVQARARTTEMAPPPAHIKLAGQAQMWRIFIAAKAEWQGRPLHEAIVARLRQLDIAGATVLPADGDLVVIVVDAAAKLAAVRPALEEMVQQGLILQSDVDVVFYRATPPA